MTKKIDEVEGTDPLADVVGIVDVKMETEGEWFEHAPLDREEAGPNEIDGLRRRLIDENGNGLRRVFVRSRHVNDAYQRDVKSVTNRAIRMPKSDRQKFEDEMENVLIAKHAIVDWELTNRHGQTIPYTRELGERFLKEKPYRYHRSFILAALYTHEGAIERTREEDQGN